MLIYKNRRGQQQVAADIVECDIISDKQCNTF
jgi:hypothetical protein